MHDGPNVTMGGSKARRYGSPLEPLRWEHQIPEDFNEMAASFVALHRGLNDRFPWFARGTSTLIDWHPECPTDPEARRLACTFMEGALGALQRYSEAVGKGDTSESGRLELFRHHVLASACLDAVKALQAGATTAAVIAASVAAQVGVLAGLEPLVAVFHKGGTPGTVAPATELATAAREHLGGVGAAEVLQWFSEMEKLNDDNVHVTGTTRDFTIRVSDDDKRVAFGYRDTGARVWKDGGIAKGTFRNKFTPPKKK